MRDLRLIIATYKPDGYIVDPVNISDEYDIIFVRENKKIFEIRISGLDYEIEWREILKTKLGKPSFFGNIPSSLMEKIE